MLWTNRRGRAPTPATAGSFWAHLKRTATNGPIPACSPETHPHRMRVDRHSARKIDMMKLCLTAIVVSLINSHPASLGGKRVRICEYADGQHTVQKQIDIDQDCSPTLKIKLF